MIYSPLHSHFRIKRNLTIFNNYDDKLEFIGFINEDDTFIIIDINLFHKSSIKYENKSNQIYTLNESNSVLRSKIIKDFSVIFYILSLLKFV